MSASGHHKGPPRIPRFIARPRTLPPEILRLPRAELIEAVPWEDWLPPLILYAAWLHGHYWWRGDRGGHPAGAPDPRDFVCDAVSAWCDGKRVFHPEDIGLFEWLCGGISSLIDRAARRCENRTPHLKLGKGRRTEPADGEVDEATIDDDQPSGADDQAAANELFRLFRDGLTGLLKRYVDVVHDKGPLSAKEAAALLGVEVRVINSLRKALDRRRKLWRGTPPPSRPRRKRDRRPTRQ